MAVTTISKTLVRPVVLAGAIIGTLEALTWTILSLICVFYYENVIEIDSMLSSSSYSYYIYLIFLNHSSTYNDANDYIISPRNFNLFMYFYVIFSFIWLLISSYLAWAMIRDKWKHIVNLTGFWAAVTLTISIVDLILMSVVAADYVKYKENSDLTTPVPTVITTTPFSTTIGNSTISALTTLASSTIITTTPFTSTTGETTNSSSTTLSPTTVTTTPFSTTTEQTTDGTTTGNSTALEFPVNSSIETLVVGAFGLIADKNNIQLLLSSGEGPREVILTAYGIVISAAARGYILWIVNVTFAIILAIFAYNMNKGETPSLLPIIDAYSTGPRPFNLYEQTDIGNGEVNEGFESKEIIFSRRESLDPAHRPRHKSSNPSSHPTYLYSHNEEATEPPTPLTESSQSVLHAKLAKIGKSGSARSPSYNVPPPSLPAINLTRGPFIPDPDYTPPNSPNKLPKSVLRPKSNYVL